MSEEHNISQSSNNQDQNSRQNENKDTVQPKIPATSNQKPETTSQPGPQTEHMETHAHHLHKTPGKNFWHYFFEFFMLFLAVTLGFFVENEREHFVEQRREKQFMSLLLGDLKTDTTAFKRVIMSYKNTSKTMDSLIDLLKNPERNKSAGKIYYFAKLVVFDTLFVTVNKTYEQMKTSGNLRLIHDPSLIDSLGFYYYNFQELENFGPGRMLFELRRDLYTTYDKLFDASVFQQMMSPPDSSGVIIPPEDNPPLLTNEPGIINEICMRVHNMYFVKRVIIGQARRNIKRATNLIKKIEEEYHLE
jgi:hypothetical protein